MESKKIESASPQESVPKGQDITEAVDQSIRDADEAFTAAQDAICAETRRIESRQSPEHNPPKDPSLAETKVLPRFRELGPDEVIQEGDECFFDGTGPWDKVGPWSVGKKWNDSEFHRMRRPIAPAPQATEPKAPVLGDATAPAPADKAELDKLCAFILMNFTGEWDRKESTADVAIRYLKSVSILKDAVTKATGAMRAIEIELESDKRHGVSAYTIVDNIKEIFREFRPAMVSIIQPDGGKA